MRVRLPARPSVLGADLTTNEMYEVGELREGCEGRNFSQTSGRMANDIDEKRGSCFISSANRLPPSLLRASLEVLLRSRRPRKLCGAADCRCTVR